jgi:fumarylpyruvate hydrolase
MTRRDLQLIVRDKGRSWDLGKDVEQSSVVSDVVPMPDHVIDKGALELRVNGVTKQKSDIDN